MDALVIRYQVTCHVLLRNSCTLLELKEARGQMSMVEGEALSRQARG